MNLWNKVEDVCVVNQNIRWFIFRGSELASDSLELSLCFLFLSLTVLFFTFLNFVHILEVCQLLFSIHIFFLLTPNHLSLITVFQAEHGLIFLQSQQLGFFIVDFRFTDSLFAVAFTEGEESFSKFLVFGYTDHQAVVVFACLFLDAGEKSPESSFGGSAFFNPISKESNCIFDNVFYISGLTFFMIILEYHRRALPSNQIIFSVAFLLSLLFWGYFFNATLFFDSWCWAEGVSDGDDPVLEMNLGNFIE